MKKLLQLTVLMGLTTLAIVSRPVLASPLCTSIHGTSCTTVGAMTNCTTSDGFPSTCTCSTSHLWRCKL